MLGSLWLQLRKEDRLNRCRLPCPTRHNGFHLPWDVLSARALISNTRPCTAKELSKSLWNKQGHEEMYRSKNQKWGITQSVPASSSGPQNNPRKISICVYPRRDEVAREPDLRKSIYSFIHSVLEKKRTSHMMSRPESQGLETQQPRPGLPLQPLLPHSGSPAAIKLPFFASQRVVRFVSEEQRNILSTS